MPRVSAAAFGVVPIGEAPFPPPAHLGEAEKAAFPGRCRDLRFYGHFRPEDRELLALYACHTISARKLMKRKRRDPEQERELRILTALIMASRLFRERQVPRPRTRGAACLQRRRGDNPALSILVLTAAIVRARSRAHGSRKRRKWCRSIGVGAATRLPGRVAEAIQFFPF